RLGEELLTLHLMDSPVLDSTSTSFVSGASREVEKVTWADNTVWIDRGGSTGFRGVSEQIWNFHVGGYRVCEKWLKDRRGLALSAKDIDHFKRIVESLNHTVRIMDEIDAFIEARGGWPWAFRSMSPGGEQ